MVNFFIFHNFLQATLDIKFRTIKNVVIIKNQPKYWFIPAILEDTNFLRKRVTLFKKTNAKNYYKNINNNSSNVG